MRKITFLALVAMMALAMASETGFLDGDEIPTERIYNIEEPGCVTDSECALHCPPPADDPDCDGGPQ